MSDTERLNLIEHYKWDIICYGNARKKPWMICGKFSKISGKTLREAFDLAFDAQAKWALS